MKRRSFFLLEVMIAVLLVGIFAYLSLGGIYRSLGKQKQAIRALEYSRLVDLKRMELIKDCWSQLETLTDQAVSKDKGPISFNIKNKTLLLNPHQQFEVKCTAISQEKLYLLTIEEIRPKEFKSQEGQSTITYHYFIKKTQDKDKAATL